MSTRRPLPSLLLTPRYCVVVEGQRWLHLGVFNTAQLAQRRWDEYIALSALRPRVATVEPVWVSRRFS